MITGKDITDLLESGEISPEAAHALRMRLDMSRSERVNPLLLQVLHAQAHATREDVDVPCLRRQTSAMPCACRNCRGWRGKSEEGRA